MKQAKNLYCLCVTFHFIPDRMKLREHLGSELQNNVVAILSIKQEYDPLGFSCKNIESERIQSVVCDDTIEYFESWIQWIMECFDRMENRFVKTTQKSTANV